jgi:hypothetical protein
MRRAFALRSERRAGFQITASMAVCRALSATEDLLTSGGRCRERIWNGVRAPALIQRCCARFVKVSIRAGCELDISVDPAEGRKIYFKKRLGRTIARRQ